MTEEERYLFDLQGYLIIEDVLETAELQELNGLLDGYDLWNQPRGEDLFFDFWENDDHQISAGPLHRWGTPFRHLISHPRIVPYLTELLGSQFRYDHGHAMVMYSVSDDPKRYLYEMNNGRVSRKLYMY